jgi:ABC-type Fe3+ transport system permease subunit
MGSTIAAIVTVIGLALFHLRIRRHPQWRSSADARYSITLGYPLVLIAVYWLAQSWSGSDWAWIVGSVWAVVAMVAFVQGFKALDAAPGEPPTAPPQPARDGRRARFL